MQRYAPPLKRTETGRGPRRFGCVGGVFLHRLQDLEEDPALRKLMYVTGVKSEFPQDVLEVEQSTLDRTWTR